jgi:phospholipase/lecithinase/hemolysin
MTVMHKMLGVAMLACASLATSAAPYSSVVVFGDSLSDPGNAAALTARPDGTSFFPPSPFPYAGRFSNGPTAAEYLAAGYGAPVVGGWPDATGANNFAVGGATTGAGNFNAFVDSPTGLQAGFPAVAATGMAQQIARYDPRGLNPDSTLFLLWGGPNDFFQGFALSQAGVAVDYEALVSTAVTHMAGHIQALAGLGATNILVPNMPDLGLTPFATRNGPSFAATATALSDAYNSGLAAVVSGSRTALGAQGVDVFGFDTAGFLRGAVASPFPGLSNVTDSCLSGGLSALGSNCAGYLFFDDVHPTTAGHQLLARQFAMAAAVPEPQTWALLLIGLSALAWRVRGRVAGRA